MEDLFDTLIQDHERIENNEEESDENKERDDSPETSKRVANTSHKVINKRPTLDILRLTGPRGLGAIENMSKEVVLKGNGHEKEDLNKIISLLHYWTHRLYPKMTFEDCLEKIETLGKKRSTQIKHCLNSL